jgi:hypothetical protein
MPFPEVNFSCLRVVSMLSLGRARKAGADFPGETYALSMTVRLCSRMNWGT